MNIPIYRAKKIDSDEWVEGSLVEYKYITKEYTCKYNRTTEDVLEIRCAEIDPSTLAIHFDGMVDKDGKKIFAGLSEDGKGGDVLLNVYSEYQEELPLIFKIDGLFLEDEDFNEPFGLIDLAEWEVIGVKE